MSARPISWLHELDSPRAHSLRNRDWDGAEAHCGKRFPHESKTKPLETWSQPCEDCAKVRRESE